jgi:predicted nucleic acid-binding protein
VTLAAVTDAGPLIHLAEIDSLALLDAFDTLLVPETVREEVEAGGMPDALSDRSCEVVAAAGAAGVPAELDAGERAAIAVADDRGAILLTDDLAARDAAAEMGIEAHGSIGVIALGCSRDLLTESEAESRMRALQRETSLFVTDAVVERGIEMLDED